MLIKMIAVFLICFITVMVTMPTFINFLKKSSLKQSVSEYALDDDKKKAGTPIMGGVLFILVPFLVVPIVGFGEFNGFLNWIVLFSFVCYGLIGFTDDYLIAIKKNNDGLKPAYKFGLQILLAILFFLAYQQEGLLSLQIPFVAEPITIGWGYFVLVLFMFAGSSNAVNLTDGMDGLASGVTIIALIPYIVITYVQMKFGLTIFCLGLEGALLGYLYYNKKPARVFMGDTGSLALGGVLAALAMATKTELLLVIIAGVPVIETVCVIIQQVAVRTVHKRVFTYTPIHYAFRIKGMPEKNIVRMFWLVEACFAAIALLIYF